jgi:superfamily II DNA or RNA helicase
MACALDFSTLTPQQFTTIQSILSFKPKVQKSKYHRVNVEPIELYHIEQIRSTTNGAYQRIIHIPYLFASSLLQIIPNDSIPFPKAGIKFTGQLRPNQINEEAEAWQQLQRYGTSTLGLYPGFGKTIIGTALGVRSGLVICTLVTQVILTGQWAKTAETFSDAKVWIVGEQDMPDEFNFIICMDTRWHLVPRKVRDSVGFLIIDEAHMFCTPTRVGCLLAFHPKYVLAESASLLRDDDMHEMIYSICGSHGVMREIGKPFTIMKVITNVTPARKKNRMGGVDWASLVTETLYNERRNKIIVDLVCANLDRKILILTSHVDHVDLIDRMLKQKKIHCDTLCGNKKSYDDATVLTGTKSKIGTGFDQATFCPVYDNRPFDLLILVCSIKKYQQLLQNVGRCFRAAKPVVMHLVDNDSIYTSHWYKARKWYLAHGGSIVEYNIPNEEEKCSNDMASQWLAQKIMENRK